MAVQDLRPLYVAAILTWIAGLVDAVGFLSLGSIYTANMSGNSVAIGIQAVRQNVPEFLTRLWPVVIYFSALLFCRLLLEFGARKKITRMATVTTGIEVVLLLFVAAGAPPAKHVPQNLQVIYVALLASAMGIQNAAMTHFSNLTLHTGFVTGTLVKASEQAAKYLAWLTDEIRKQNSWRPVLQSPRHKAFQQASILGGIWLAYVFGAAAGAFTFLGFTFRALFFAIAGLLLVIGMDMVQPLAVREEQEQAAPAA